MRVGVCVVTVVIVCTCFSRNYQTGDHLEDADLEDYDDDTMTEKENKTQQEDNREEVDDPDEDGDGDHSYEDDLDFDDYNEQDGDQSDKGCGDSRLNNTSRVSDVEKRRISLLMDEGEGRHGSQEYVSGEETEGKEQEEENDYED